MYMHRYGDDHGCVAFAYSRCAAQALRTLSEGRLLGALYEKIASLQKKIRFPVTEQRKGFQREDILLEEDKNFHSTISHFADQTVGRIYPLFPRVCHSAPPLERRDQNLIKRLPVARRAHILPGSASLVVGLEQAKGETKNCVDCDPAFRRKVAHHGLSLARQVDADA